MILKICLVFKQRFGRSSCCCPSVWEGLGGLFYLESIVLQREIITDSRPLGLNHMGNIFIAIFLTKDVISSLNFQLLVNVHAEICFLHEMEDDHVNMSGSVF